MLSKVVKYPIHLMSSNQKPDKSELDKHYKDKILLVIKYEEEIWIYGLDVKGNTKLTRSFETDVYKNFSFTEEPKMLREKVDDIYQNILSIAGHIPEALNQTQKAIITSYLQYPLDDIVETYQGEHDRVISTLEWIMRKKISPQEENAFKELQGGAKQINNILFHDCPQNRRVGDPTAAYFQTDGIICDTNGIAWVHYWAIDKHGKRITASEHQGLLGLTAKNDETAPPVTKNAVVKYIHKLINQVIDEQRQKFLPFVGLGRYQIMALKELSDTGLTRAHIENWRNDKGDKGCFDRSHKDALAYLIRQHQFSPEAAIAEISGLGAYEAKAISEGFKRNEVIGLQSEEIAALKELRDTGLTKKHFESWHDEKHCSYGYFFSNHKNALVYLIRQRQYSPEAAIAEINGLSMTQAAAISEGYTRNKVVELQYQQIKALEELEGTGLTKEHFKSWEGDFLSTHKNALVYLIRQRQFSPETAIAEISGLNFIQVSRITGGESRQQILGNRLSF